MIAEHSHDAFLVTAASFSDDIGGHKILYANAALEQQSGYSRDEMVGRTPRFLNAPDADNIEIERIKKAVQANQPVRARVKNRRKDGTTYWVEATILPMTNASGVHTHWVSIQRDISERIIYEKQMLDAVPAMAVIVDNAGLIIDMNEQWARWAKSIDITASRYVGSDYFGSKENDNPGIDTFLSDLRNVLDGRLSRASYEYSCFEGGGRRWYRCKAAPLSRFGKEEPLCALIMHVDITDAREAEWAAQEASRFKSAFVSNMSHEIRTPMNVIVGFANSLCRSAWNPADSDKLNKICQAANHLLGIIDNILDLSKIEAGKLQIENRPFNLHRLLSTVLSHVSALGEAKDLKIMVEADPDLPDWLLGDPQRLSQCFINYGGNAVKFTEAGVVTLRVVLDQRVDPGLLIRFEVEDTGIGIASEAIPLLFSAFVQADQSTTRRFGGTGLGLAFTRELASLMGGDVGVVSMLGKGSRFWFTAVLRPAPEDSQADASAQEETLGGAGDFSTFRLLVAEDVALNREVLQDMLDDAGISADMAENGEVAVRMARAFPYDLILMDMQMPILDGLAATRAIRQLAGYETTPIIALTANAFNQDRARCVDAGMNDFLTKPLRSEKLLTALSRWLSGNKEIRPPQPSGNQSPVRQQVATAGPNPQGGMGLRAAGPIIIDELLDNLDGNRDLARRMLNVFRESFREAGGEIRQLVDRERLDLADNCIHALKGAAGQIAAIPLHQALGELEIALLALRELVRKVTTTLDETLTAADVVGRAGSFPDLPPSQRAP